MKAAPCLIALASLLALAACNDDATESGAGGSGSGGSSSGEPHQLCVDQINDLRATVSLADYQRWASAEDCSDQQAADDAAAGTPNSTTGACGELTSTTCFGVQGPASSMLPSCLNMMWGGGPGDANYDMLASDTYTQVACGFHTETDGSMWLMLNFQ